MGFITVLSLSEEEKTHNRGSNLSPRGKFLDGLAISDSLFFPVL